MRAVCVWLLSIALGLQCGSPHCADEDEEAEFLRELFQAISGLSGYAMPQSLPKVSYRAQHEIEAMVCEAPCSIVAAYLPGEGVFLSANLIPQRDPVDRAALVHELVHHLQQGHAKFADLHGCRRERAKEEEAYAIQNAYLHSIGRRERVVFYDGGFHCE